MAASFQSEQAVQKQEYRVVIIADAYDPETLVQQLVAAGIRPRDVHVSHDRHNDALARDGVRYDVPCGVIRVESFVPCQDSGVTRPNPVDHLVP